MGLLWFVVEFLVLLIVFIGDFGAVVFSLNLVMVGLGLCGGGVCGGWDFVEVCVFL